MKSEFSIKYEYVFYATFKHYMYNQTNTIFDKPCIQRRCVTATGIEAKSYNPLGSLRRHSERSGLEEVGDLQIPRPRTGSKSDQTTRRSSAESVSDPFNGPRTLLVYLNLRKNFNLDFI